MDEKTRWMWESGTMDKKIMRLLFFLRDGRWRRAFHRGIGSPRTMDIAMEFKLITCRLQWFKTQGECICTWRIAAKGRRILKNGRDAESRTLRSIRRLREKRDGYEPKSTMETGTSHGGRPLLSYDGGSSHGKPGD